MKRNVMLLTILSLLFLFSVAYGSASANQDNNGYGENLLDNPGFEEIEDGIPVSWAAKDNWASGSVFTSEEAARSGDSGVQIDIEPTTDYWIRQTVSVEGGELYELSTWLKSDVPDSMYHGRAVMKVEFYRDTTDVAGWRGQQTGTGYYQSIDEWEFKNMYAEVPDDANVMQVYLRLYGPGEAYFDDASLRKVPHIPGLHIEADRVFYYAEMEEGKISGTIGLDDVSNDMTIDVTIASDDGVPIVNETGLPATEYIEFQFDPSLMTLREPYTVEVELKSAQGEVLFQDNETIYRWERPSAIREDGVMIVDGEPFFPVIGYHVMGYSVPVEDYPKVRQTVNTLQGNNSNPNSATIEHQLNQALEHDLKVVVPLYPNVWDLEGRLGYQYVEEIVTEFQDHPAVIGWMIQDEPNKFENQGHPTIHKDITEIYRLVRSLDPVHPTYTVINDPAGFDTFGRLTDIVVTDPYPLDRDPITLVRDHVREAKELNPEKPVWNVLQSFFLPGNSRYPYLPNITELRNMTYQSIIEGAQGLGYYSFIDPGWDLMESDLYPGMIDFTETELPHFEQVILYGQVVESYQDEDVMWRLWELDDQLYVAMANVTEQEQEVTVALPGANYKAEVITRQNEQYHLFDDQLGIRLSGLETKLIRLEQSHSSSTLLELIEELADEGEFANDGAIRTLRQEMTKIERFENRGDTANVIRHMGNFNQLLDSQYESNLISGEGYRRIREQADSLLQRMSESLLHMNMQLQKEALVTGETLQIQLKLHNRGDKKIQDPLVTIHWPEEFGLAPTQSQWADFNAGQSREDVVEVEVPDDIPYGRHIVQVEVQFKYQGVITKESRVRGVELLPIIELTKQSENITAHEPGLYPLSYSIRNNASYPVVVRVREELPEGFQFELNQPVTLQAKQTIDLEGNLLILDSAQEQEYAATLPLIIDDVEVAELHLSVIYTENLLKNPGFEQLEDDQAIDWEANDRWDSGDVTISSDTMRSGDHALKLTRNVTSGDARVKQLADVTGGETYELSAWLKSEIAGNGRAQMKVEFYRDVTGAAGYKGDAFSPEFGTFEEWEQVAMPVIVPEDANIVSILLRLYGPGTAYYDDVSLHRLKDME